ncbi:MAG: hypothetical protein KGL26_01105 [Pseudomonadota bacterium]|nr:hypothetical protein [Pseudomonadota bacterium]
MTPSIATIQKAVAEALGIPVAWLSGRSQGKVNEVRPRHAAMWLCRQLTPASLPELGRHFGRRDHTSVAYGIQRYEQRWSQDAHFRALVEKVKARLEDEPEKSDDIERFIGPIIDRLRERLIAAAHRQPMKVATALLRLVDGVEKGWPGETAGTATPTAAPALNGSEAGAPRPAPSQDKRGGARAGD